MDWTNEVVLEFLELYEKEQVIWNASLSTHKNRNEVYDAWKRIEIGMNQKFSITDLKKKKDSLMASFRTCLNKMKQSIKSGAGTEDIYKPHWFAYQKMASFLRDKDQPRETIHSEDIFTQDEYENNEYEEENNIAPNTPECTGYSTDTINDAVILPSTSKSIPKNPLRKRKKIAEEDELKNKMNNAYCILQDTINGTTKQKNVCDIYGELIAAKLKTMDERNREICMHRIDTIFFEMKVNCNMSSNNFDHCYSNEIMTIATSPNYSRSSISPNSQNSVSVLEAYIPEIHSQTPSPHQTTTK